MKTNIMVNLTVLTLLIIFNFQLLSSNSIFPPINSIGETTQYNRGEIVWSTGYWALPTNWNPYWWDGKAWGEFFMYMPLFDINYETGELLGFIGESFEWTNKTTMTITLRPEAEWSDGNPITVDDVIFTWDFLLVGAQGSIAERVASYEKVDATTLKIHVKPEYPHSQVLFDHLLGNCDRVIGAKHVWMEIYDWLDNQAMDDSVDFTDNSWETVSIAADWAFKNNWLDDSFFPNGSAFPEKWKVSSGPYRPYEVSETRDRQVYIRDDAWWGNDVWNQPKPKYIGQIHYADTLQMNQAFANDEIDWYGAYYPRIWELLEVNPNIQTWTLGEEPYFLPLSTMVELVPNHLRFPFNQQWLRKALAYAINVEDMSEVATSGYLQRARQGYIDDRSPMQKHVYDANIQAEYGIDFNTTKAIEILDEHCFKYYDRWYTNDVPPGFIGMPGPNNSTIVDGWSDSMLQTILLADYFANTIGIACNPAFLEYRTYVNKFQAMDFDLMNLCLGFQPIGRPWQELGKFIGSAGAWTNYSAWYNPEYAALHEEWETVDPTNITGEKLIASRMQELLANKIPAIPISPNGYWMAYNTRYWHGWPNKNDKWIQVCAPWAITTIGSQLMYIFHLIPTAEVTTTIVTTTTSPTTTGPPITTTTTATTTTTTTATTTTTTTTATTTSASSTTKTSTTESVAPKITSWRLPSIFIAIIFSVLIVRRRKM